MTAIPNLPKKPSRLWLVTSMCVLLTAGLTTTAHAAKWYVLAPDALLNQSQGPFGSRKNPLRSLSEAENRSASGDTIFILPSPFMLDGGIQLKTGQKLLGLDHKEFSPTLTNTSNYLDGDAVRTADHTEVADLHISGTRRGAITGFDVDDVSIHDNLITGFNTSRSAVDDDMLWPGIVILATGRSEPLKVRIEANVLTDADVGGVLVGSLGPLTDVDVRFEKNSFVDLVDEHTGSFLLNGVSLLCGGARLTARSSGEFVDSVGTSLVGDSIGFFMEAWNSCQMDVVVDEYTYRNTQGIGSPDDSGLESAVSGPGGAHLSLLVKNSSIRESADDSIQILNLGNTTMDVVIRDTELADSNPVFLGGLLNLAVVPSFSVPTGARADTTVMLERCDLLRSGFAGISVINLDFDNLSNVVIDYGGGDLGSKGRNRIVDSAVAEAIVLNADVNAKNNYWGAGVNTPRLITEWNVLGTLFTADPSRTSLISDPVLKNDPEQR